MQTFYSGSAKYTNISRRNQVSMALFLCANIHQGDKLFSVHSGGKQSLFKNSLIIHEENTKKNHKRVVSLYVDKDFPSFT